MFRIESNHRIAGNAFFIEIVAPEIAPHVQPGHFVDIHVSVDGTPLTIPVSDFDRDKGTITVVHEASDIPGRQLKMLQKDDELFQVSGPLGEACEFAGLGKVVLAAEDLGVGSAYCRAREYKKKGSYTICVLGFGTKDDVFWEERFAALCDELYVCTRDGSYGVKSGITAPLRAVCESHKNIERITVIGGLATMKKIAKVASDYNIRAFVSFDVARRQSEITEAVEFDKGGQKIFGFAKSPDMNADEIDFDKLLEKQRALQKESEGATPSS